MERYITNQLRRSIIKYSICFLLNLAVIFGYGFTVGGNTNMIFYALMIVCCLLVVLVVKGKDFFKRENIMLIVLIVSLGSLINGGFYYAINKNLDNSEPVRSYYSKVDDYPGSSFYEDIMWFKDPQGNVKEYIKYNPLTSSRLFEIGESIYVEEYKGVFNVEHYIITKDKARKMDMSETLKSVTSTAKTVNDYINGFEEFCKVESGDSEEVCFLETGNYDFSGEDEFYFSLVRQYKVNPSADEYIQVHMDIIFDPIKANNQGQIWSDEFDSYEEFFSAVKSSEFLNNINDNNLKPKRIDIYADET